MSIEEQIFNPALTLEDDIVKLRLVRESDISELCGIAFDSSIWTYFTSEINNEQELKDYVTGALGFFEAKSQVPFVIIKKGENDEETIVGMSSFGNISIRDRRIEIGWSWINPNWQGKGINTSYKRLLTNFAFETLDFMRMEFKTDVLNERARKALLKIGATEEGVLRSHTLMPHDRRRDTIYYSILRNEWNG